MDREAEARRDLAQAPGLNPMGNELFTVTRKTYYTAPSGKRMLATIDVKERQPFLPVAAYRSELVFRDRHQRPENVGRALRWLRSRRVQHQRMGAAEGF